MLVKSPLYHFWKNNIASGLKKARLRTILRLAGLAPVKRPRVLEIGCANGKDALQFLSGGEYELFGLDIKPCVIDLPGVTFVQGDAAALPFEAQSFDLVLTVGLLEHIEPMEKLSAVIKEIERVGRAYVNVMPSVSTPLEPHALRPFWPLRLQRRFVDKDSRDNILKLNFFTDHTWTKFEGFGGASVCRKWYLWPLVRNTFVYKSYK